MKTTIYLIRHSQTFGNTEERLAGRTDYELTEAGKIYVDKLTERLKEVRFDSAYVSTSSRTLKTILPLIKLNNLEVNKSEDLCEMSFGIYDGEKWSVVNEIAPQIKQRQNETNEIIGIPGQEDTQTVANRMYKKIEEIAKDNLGKTVLICSHGVAIEAFIRKITNTKFIENKEENSQKNTAVNIISYENGAFILEVLNDIAHLK